MDKNVLKRFAIESRKHLHEKVADRYALYYLDEEFDEVERNELYTLTNEKHNLVLTKEQYEHRQKLINKKDRYGKEHVIEEAAFTWFNRFICLRYMELHNFLPLGKNNESLDIRVLSSRDGNKEPEILKRNNLTNNALDINVDIDKFEKIADIKDKYEKVLLKVCEKMGRVLPQIFDGETDYIELLMPKNQLNVDSFLDKLLKEVPEDNFDDIEVIGWLYQYYNQSEKDRVMKEKRAYKKSEIPYVTQIFTPDWIVKYMVENSLGRLWIENTGDESLESEFKYFIKDNIEIKGAVGASSASPMLPENITFIDPCMGSGHILVYAFEVFMKLYISAGYNKKDIPELILKNNLYGLDIDDRAGQFAIISVMLKAREYDSEIFNKIDFNSLNILSIPESNPEHRRYANDIKDKEVREIVDYLIDTFENGKEIGSLLIVEEKDYDKVAKYFEEATPNIFNRLLWEGLKDIIRVAKILGKKYDVVVTNPPYLNNSGMSKALKEYIVFYFKEYKIDIFASFIKRIMLLVVYDRYMSFMTPNVWIYLYYFKDLRKLILNNCQITSFIELAKGAFFNEATVDLVTFVLKNNVTNNNCYFIRLAEYKGNMEYQKEMFLNTINNCEGLKNIYKIKKDYFDNIPDYCISYWLSYNMIEKYFDAKQHKNQTQLISDISFSDGQILTGNNEKYIRFIWEVENDSINKSGKWMFHAKGGEYRRWYGNIDSVVSWTSESIKHYKTDKIARFPKNEILFRKGITWNLISSSNQFGMRLLTDDVTFNKAAATILFYDDMNINYTLGFLNSIVARTFLCSINPTLNTNIKDVLLLPLIRKENKNDEIGDIVNDNIMVSKKDWDSFETSWDFKKHPLV